eukprot:scaffold16306_cov113-Cylindrotheca_fusiformis.AAC.2
MDAPGTSSKIPRVMERLFLLAVEKRNLPRANVVLSEILDANQDTFGAKSSPQRHAIQEYWYNVKRRSIRSYCRLLSSFGVPKSGTTLRLLQEEGLIESADNSVVSEEYGRDDGFLSSFEKLAINTNTPTTNNKEDRRLIAVDAPPAVLSFSSPSTLSPAPNGTHH